MIDTQELGAGSYPQAPESKEKHYQFEFEASIKCIGTIYALSEEEAREFIEKGKYEDIDTKDMKIENITEIKEVND